MENSLQKTIEAAWLDRELLKKEDVKTAIRAVVDQLDRGEIRVAEQISDGPEASGWVS